MVETSINQGAYWALAKFMVQADYFTPAYTFAATTVCANGFEYFEAERNLGCIRANCGFR